MACPHRLWMVFDCFWVNGVEIVQSSNALWWLPTVSGIFGTIAGISWNTWTSTYDWLFVQCHQQLLSISVDYIYRVSPLVFDRLHRISLFFLTMIFTVHLTLPYISFGRPGMAAKLQEKAHIIANLAIRTQQNIEITMKLHTNYIDITIVRNIDIQENC